MSASTSAQRGGVRQRLRREHEFDFIGRSRTWLYLTIALVALSLLGVAVRGLNFGIEFTGGTSYVVTGATRDFTSEQLRDALGAAGVSESIVQVVSDDAGAGALISTPAVGEIGGAQQQQVLEAIAQTTGVSVESIDVQAIGPRWGAQISRQALRGLVVFLVLVAAYISLRFEWRMAASALLTLVHDVIVTIGIYALIGFQVTPASVIALLTILGYSLYDTIVVFDRVKEDTAGVTSVATRTYGEVANAALNHVLVRSLSTSITSLLPVASLLFIGANLLGADTLQDLALALFIGMAVGAYSSLVIATPFLVWLKEREPRYAELRERVLARRGKTAASPSGRRGT